VEQGQDTATNFDVIRVATALATRQFDCVLGT